MALSCLWELKQADACFMVEEIYVLIGYHRIWLLWIHIDTLKVQREPLRTFINGKQGGQFSGFCLDSFFFIRPVPPSLASDTFEF